MAAAATAMQTASITCAYRTETWNEPGLSDTIVAVAREEPRRGAQCTGGARVRESQLENWQTTPFVVRSLPGVFLFGLFQCSAC